MHLRQKVGVRKQLVYLTRLRLPLYLRFLKSIFRVYIVIVFNKKPSIVSSTGSSLEHSYKQLLAKGSYPIGSL